MVKVPWWTFAIALVCGFALCWLIIVPGANKRAAADLAKYNTDTAALGSQLTDARSNVATTLAELDKTRAALVTANSATARATADAGRLRAYQLQRDANDKRLAEQLVASLASAKSGFDIYNICDAILHGLFDRYHPGAGNKSPSG